MSYKGGSLRRKGNEKKAQDRVITSVQVKVGRASRNRRAAPLKLRMDIKWHAS